ncbi:MAG: myxococcus cysteine-rich repeat containing protein [Myxococcota bacterium]
MSKPPTRILVGALVGALTLAPSVADATIYIVNPTPEGGAAVPGDTTRFFSIEEDGTGFTDLGFVTVGGANTGVGAIAMDSFGTIYGFTYDRFTGLSTLVTVDPATGAATAVGAGTPVLADLTGAAFDRDGRLWVYDRGDQSIYEFDIMTLSGVGAPLPIPAPGSTNGGDLAFDLDGNCYFQGTVPNNSSTPLYACDLDAGTFTNLGTWTRAGAWADPGHSFSGMAFSLEPNTCEPMLLGSDGYAIDELAELDITTMTADHVVSTGVNISYFNHIDVAGFASVAQVPSCNFCGDGVIDVSEECDDGNLVDGDGCSSVCLVETVDECVDEKLDWWARPLDQWPVDSLMYFDAVWTDYEILGFFGWVTDDASVTLMKQLITVDLNVATGVDPSGIQADRDAAEQLLGIINVGSDPQGADRDAALALADALAAWNTGNAGPPACEADAG